MISTVLSDLLSIQYCIVSFSLSILDFHSSSFVFIIVITPCLFNLQHDLIVFPSESTYLSGLNLINTIGQ